jgi:transposase-like protein
MNHFKGKQFQQDVIIVAVGYYLRYKTLAIVKFKKSYMIVALTFLIRRFIVGCKNMANYSIKFGKEK